VNRANQKRICILAVAFVAITAFLWLTSPALLGEEHGTKVKEAAAQSTKAAKVFDAIMQAPDKSVPRDLLARAKAVAVFPQVIKASFVVGGEGGRGVVSHRTAKGWGDAYFFGLVVAALVGRSAPRQPISFFCL
jgi:lipid-binding SYLF domain-containing protein